VENYCCLEGVLQDREVFLRGREQAERFGAVFKDEDILGVRRENKGTFQLSSESGENIDVKAIVIAAGILRNKLHVRGEE